MSEAIGERGAVPGIVADRDLVHGSVLDACCVWLERC
jgi:hypothetical protein